ncbi:MAG: ABC transporter ATP-binding protein [Planctomycetes bacterium]|nr:ABC transporter ATP-binding protein [Planctomycetota bacterium]
MADDPAVQIESLTHRYGQRVAVDDVTFGVDRASLFALLGPNGGGKTTLFKVLTTLLRPSAGTARIAGADVLQEKDRVRRRIGIVFQDPSLDEKLTVLENLTNQGHLYGLSGPKLAQRCRELLERFGIADRTRDRVQQLSGGLKRRVELAKSLLHRPEVLILDEPGTGLDPAVRATLMRHLRELSEQDGVTCLLTTHLMDEAERCDSIGFLDQGRLVALDTPSALKRTIGGDVLTVCTANPAEMARRVKERFGGQAEVVNGAVRIEREKGHEFITDLIEAFPGEMESVTVGKPTLEDVFVHLTGHRLSDSEHAGG